jgi:hypothetical protein
MLFLSPNPLNISPKFPLPCSPTRSKYPCEPEDPPFRRLAGPSRGAEGAGLSGCGGIAESLLYRSAGGRLAAVFRGGAGRSERRELLVAALLPLPLRLLASAWRGARVGDQVKHMLGRTYSRSWTPPRTMFYDGPRPLEAVCQARPETSGRLLRGE